MIYESGSHREEQDRAQWVLENIGYTVKQSKTLAGWDFAMSVAGKPVALAEFKARDRPFPTIIVDVEKIDRLIETALEYGVAPLFIVHWATLGGYWAWRCHTSCPTAPFTRTKARNIAGEEQETADIVYHIPRREFILMSGVDTLQI